MRAMPMSKALLLLILGSISTLFAADISGKWVGSMESARTPRLYLSVRQSGEVVEGSVAFNDAPYPIRNVSLHGNELAFDTVYEQWPAKFRLTIAHGKMDGEMTNYQGRNVRVTLTGPVVTFPVVLRRVEAEYTEEARRLKNEGTVVLWVQVDKMGRATVLKVVRPLGNGLDERAVEAVKKWRFRPAFDHGKPVTMNTTVEVPFRLR